MPDEKLISRREVMLVAGAAALAVSTTATHAAEMGQPVPAQTGLLSC